MIVIVYCWGWRGYPIRQGTLVEEAIYIYIYINTIDGLVLEIYNLITTTACSFLLSLFKTRVKVN